MLVILLLGGDGNGTDGTLNFQLFGFFMAIRAPATGKLHLQDAKAWPAVCGPKASRADYEVLHFAYTLPPHVLIAGT